MEFYLYRDANSIAQFDGNISIGLYGYANEEYEYISKETVMLTNESPIEFDNIEDCPLNMFPYALGIYSFQN